MIEGKKKILFQCINVKNKKRNATWIEKKVKTTYKEIIFLYAHHGVGNIECRTDGFLISVKSWNNQKKITKKKIQLYSETIWRLF